MKAAGAVLLLLATVGVLSSWSAMTGPGGGRAYLVVNVLLAMTGIVLWAAGVRRRRSAATPLPPGTTLNGG